MIQCGVQLEDQDDGKVVWKLRNAKELIAEKERKEAEQAITEALNAFDNSVKVLNQWVQKRDVLSGYRTNDNGVPSEQLKDGEWTKLSKKSVKKLNKKWKKLEAQRAEFTEALAQDPELMTRLAQTVRDNLNNLEVLRDQFSAAALKERQARAAASLGAAEAGES